VLSNPTNPFCIVAVESARAAATALHLDLKVVEAAEERDLDRAFLTLSRQRPDAVLTVADPFLTSQRTRVAAFMIENRFPSMYTYREDVLAGGLISYATNYYDVFRRAAILTDKILKGAKPADLPIQQPTKFELVVNLKTAKVLGLTIPESFLVRADEVIE
jgi:putative tryptophan/tyrosine transport system substrate-binding protein